MTTTTRRDDLAFPAGATTIGGLTKREYFAIHVLPAFAGAESERAALLAVGYADALIAALNVGRGHGEPGTIR